MELEELLEKANAGDMAAQYNLAEYYGKLLKQTQDETEIYQYSLDAMLWLKRSAQQRGDSDDGADQDQNAHVKLLVFSCLLPLRSGYSLRS